MWKKILNTMILLMLFFPACVSAGPGGKIAKAVAETFWGKVILIALVIFFSPLIIYVLLKEHRAKKRVLKDLQIVARVSPDFDWIKIRKRIQDFSGDSSVEKVRFTHGVASFHEKKIASK